MNIKPHILPAAWSAGVALVGLSAFAITKHETSPPPPSIIVPAEHALPANRSRLRYAGGTRLVTCGDLKTATFVGGDERGVITLGAGANGTCTLMFGFMGKDAPTCTVTGGHVARVHESDLVIDRITGPTVSYLCTAAIP